MSRSTHIREWDGASGRVRGRRLIFAANDIAHGNVVCRDAQNDGHGDPGCEIADRGNILIVISLAEGDGEWRDVDPRGSKKAANENDEIKQYGEAHDDAADGADVGADPPIGAVTGRRGIQVGKAEIGAAGFAAQATDEKASRESESAEHPDVGNGESGGNCGDGFIEQAGNEKQAHTQDAEKDRARHREMEVCGKPGGVVDDAVHVVGGVDDAGDAAEDENHEAAEEIGEEPILVAEVGKRFPPAEKAGASTLMGGMFERSSQSECGQHAGDGDHQREYGLHGFPRSGDARVCELVMQAEGAGEHDEGHEAEATGEIAEELAAGQSRQHGVVENVNGQKPEIDEGVAEEPEKRAAEHDVDAGSPAERPREKHYQNFIGDGQGSHLPDDESSEHADHSKRRFLAGMRLAPAEIDGNPGKECYPGADDEERESEIKNGMGFERRVKRIKHGGFTEEDHNGGHDCSDEHEGKRKPSAEDGERRFEFLADQSMAEGDGEHGRENDGVNDAVGSEALIVINSGERSGAYGSSAIQHLQDAVVCAEDEQGKWNEEFGEDDSAQRWLHGS